MNGINAVIFLTSCSSHICDSETTLMVASQALPLSSIGAKGQKGRKGQIKSIFCFLFLMYKSHTQWVPASHTQQCWGVFGSKDGTQGLSLSLSLYVSLSFPLSLQPQISISVFSQN